LAKTLIFEKTFLRTQVLEYFYFCFDFDLKIENFTAVYRIQIAYTNYSKPLVYYGS